MQTDELLERIEKAKADCVEIDRAGYSMVHSVAEILEILTDIVKRDQGGPTQSTKQIKAMVALSLLMGTAVNTGFSAEEVQVVWYGHVRRSLKLLGIPSEDGMFIDTTVERLLSEAENE